MPVNIIKRKSDTNPDEFFNRILNKKHKTNVLEKSDKLFDIDF